MIEGDVITYKELVEIFSKEKDNPSIHDNVDLRKIKLKCLNCGHKDIVEGMRAKKEIKRGYGLEDYQPPPINDKINKYPRWKPIYDRYKYTIKKTTNLFLLNGSFEEFFRCPKCGSKMITILDEEISKLVSEAL